MTHFFAGRHRIAATLLALTSCATHAETTDEFRIEGQYLQNRPCKGDGTDPAGFKVTITTSEIIYSGGICSIDARRAEGREIMFSVTCKFRSGKVMGSKIAFLPRDHGGLRMMQLDGTFQAELYKCPPPR